MVLLDYPNENESYCPYWPEDSAPSVMLPHRRVTTEVTIGKVNAEIQDLIAGYDRLSRVRQLQIRLWESCR